MLKFERLSKDINLIKEFIQKSQVSFCDISLGVRFMWREEFVVEYAVLNQTLILKESCESHQNAFYYPIGEDVESALLAIEEYAKANNFPLLFGYQDEKTTAILKKRYNEVLITNDRDWRDYIYDAEKFKTYSGKKLSGQRNHVNKFRRLFPNYKFRKIEKKDLEEVKNFLNHFQTEQNNLSWAKRIEQKKATELVENMFELGQVGGIIEVDQKIIALSVGEIVGETLIVHIEKALKEYDGVYPLMAQEFAKAYAKEGIKFINREEDCGDQGLRTSKLQYQPIEIKPKNFVQVCTLFDKITQPISIKTRRLEITEIKEQDKDVYAHLYLDDKLNVWWGYNYREDLNDNLPTPDYFFDFQNLLKDNKQEFSFAVRLDGVMIGELVLHNFDYHGKVEMGFRFFKEHQNKGYAIESCLALKDYAFNCLGALTLTAKCYKQNLPSKKLIEKLGLKMTTQDKTHYYFARKRQEKINES